MGLSTDVRRNRPVAAATAKPRSQPITVWDRGSAMWLLLAFVLVTGLVAIHLL